MKTCIHCLKSKPLDRFNRNLDRGKNITYSQGCKDCINEVLKLFRKLRRSKDSLSLVERFEQYVDKSGECWIWKASIRPDGAGQFNTNEDGNRFPEPAYRTAWKIYRGKIPVGISVCHKCDNRLCVNPDHLFLGTHADNMRDMAEKERSGQAKLRKFQVLEILDSRDSQNVLARKFGVTQANINAIKRRKTWKHLGGGNS